MPVSCPAPPAARRSWSTPARYYAGLIVGALQGEDKEALLAPRYTPVEGLWQTHPLCPAIDDIAAGSFRQKRPPEIKGSGNAVKSLEVAQWAIYRSETFEAGALMAVNLGG